MADEHITYEQLVECEERVLAAEMLATRLRRLIPQPGEPGGYVGDNFYPVGGTQASHEWDGKQWQWLPELQLPEEPTQ